MIVEGVGSPQLNGTDKTELDRGLGTNQAGVGGLGWDQAGVEGRGAKQVWGWLGRRGKAWEGAGPGRRGDP